MTIDEFYNSYSHMSEKYGEGWEDVAIESLLNEGIEIEFIGE